MGVERIFGNTGVNYTTKLNAAGASNIYSPMFTAKTDSAGDTLKITTTPGNTGVAEATARGTLDRLDLIEQVGF